MREAGIYRAMVAKRFGGNEMSPPASLRLIETISQVDGSSGWVASFGFRRSICPRCRCRRSKRCTPTGRM
jgi:alkylation response protein AidB-like acyl-CoA dehydrogenase